MKSLIVHYQEIALKGKNRPWFIARLVRNLREATADVGVREVRALMGRIEIVLGRRGRLAGGPRAGRPRVRRGRTSRRRGGRRSTSTRSPRRSSPTSASATCASFRVSARRADKRFPMTSPRDRARGRRPDQGGARLARRPRQAGVDDPRRGADARGVLLLRQGARRRRACRSASSGRVACLLSGGIDSPVAAWRMMRRGCRVLFVHFHSYPILSRASQEKVARAGRGC